MALCLLMQTNRRAITPSQSRMCFIFVGFVSGCVFAFLRHYLCLTLALSLSLSIYITWSVFLSLPLPLSSSFLILFISHRDAPQRHSAELSDLNKCLRLELGLSCGLGCRCGSQSSSHFVVLRCLNESLSRLPLPPPPSVTLSLWHLFLMGWEMCGKPQPLSLSRQIRELTFFLSQMQIQCEKCLGNYSLCNKFFVAT